MKNMLEAIILDLDDTLYEYETVHQKAMHALCLFTCRELSISERSFYEAFDWAKKETKQKLGETGASHNRMLYCQKTLDYLRRYSARLTLAMYNTYWDYLLEQIRLREGAQELLELCRYRGIKVGICSDLTAQIQHRKIIQLGISNWIDAVVTSEEAGAEKPAGIMYQMILEKLHTVPEKALFIGDSQKKDVEGPQRMGISALWLHPDGSQDVRTISNLNEVKDFLYEQK